MTKEYVVVARRYRPQSFQDLVGQGQVSQALGNAIATNRVGHAYLFTGARGVGKTSTARIFAKALNCAKGPTATPCGECDICKGIASGDDVDVLEIDGASNRGIDEIRQLRSNVNIRPGRSRFKIYIIDEVHMLTTPAFNALLKTLEEPPDHVKFFFCTTDPEKIPITVLSRCQRFDFAPVEVNSILDRLQFIVDSEGLEAEKEALQLLARRAAGSMRDSQSLLEQLLSFCSGKITVDDVHSMLGTAQSGRLSALSARLGDRDAAGALAAVDSAISEGVDVGQLAEQLLGYFRDMMAALVGCEADFMLHTSANEYAELLEAGQRLGLETNLAVIQILDQSIMRMRHSTHTRTLLEIALVRICQLESLDELAGIVAQLRAGVAANSPRLAATRPAASAPPMPEKKTEKIPDQPAHSPVHESPSIPITSESANSIWKQAIAQIQDMTADYAAFCDRVAISAPNRLVASFKASYTLQKESCEKPERKARIEQALQQVTGQRIHVDFEVRRDEGNAPSRPQPRPSLRQRMRDFEKHPLVKQAIDMFEAEITRIEEPRPE
ncbi:MAG: DNA polymerase III subunit gamma/tau [Planctomycetaceae bacterium]|nr:DNA polymerase III subunit gamma/tau [Planctomycetales bacterium]MCB9923296.1 DNA polymerase III subunit gamma/tau [Planctomycetaceae bacterium]